MGCLNLYNKPRKTSPITARTVSFFIGPMRSAQLLIRSLCSLAIARRFSSAEFPIEDYVFPIVNKPGL